MIYNESREGVARRDTPNAVPTIMKKSIIKGFLLPIGRLLFFSQIFAIIHICSISTKMIYPILMSGSGQD